ncbi:hypothetical protein Tsubulata_004783 [Turnera subulata]|uniref:NAC domain-containing protein n=1 Tax=Turnera subulata TaxID=218843 RepID=A0A9Q0J406_9ROSI|nr:hypothetical protein Tsubulata_004783 [Turnera subulata]
MARAWLIDGRSIARKVSNAGPSSNELKEWEAKRECPKCHHQIDNSDVSVEWPGLPLGVKFDPSDAQLVEHLAAKCGIGNSKPHAFIDEFIPTIDGEKGICYTHPENLPGAKKDGSSVHFFHRTVNAYASGQRKRRKVHSENGSNEERVRWHKTGKTKPVIANGVQIGCKKIMVLYKSSKKGSKPDKANWVVHQYHLGTDEDEKEGQYVLSKISYQQQRQSDKDESCLTVENTEIPALHTTPRTPNPNPPNPPRQGQSILYDDVAGKNMLQSSAENKEVKEEVSYVSVPAVQLDDDVSCPASAWLAGESQAVDDSGLNCINDSLFCKEINGSSSQAPHTGIGQFDNVVAGNNTQYGISDLENIVLDTPPDFQLAFSGQHLWLARQTVKTFDEALGFTMIYNKRNSSFVPSQLAEAVWNAALLKDIVPKLSSTNVRTPCIDWEDSVFPSFLPLNHNSIYGWSRSMSTSKGRSMRSKVERRMRKESGKTLREIRRAKKLKKKLMTDEERLIYNLKRAKKKVALLLQKLKKYELPELPDPVHDPELLTPEQLQAYKKIGFKNKNYVPVGVRGVFGGVVQNMHMHWKFHETVQVCCDNFPKEKIKEMAVMLARLSGGIVVNVHNVKTIIMFRGRNYRQPKNLIPINTLTKRKALFKARFEQALESQKLNIKKIEQQLRRMGVNPEDPVAMASIQRVAATFFNAIDQKEGSPYVFRGDKQPMLDPTTSLEDPEPSADSDQEELDRFIAEIEDAADEEWAAEEEAEKEEYGRIRYWNREDSGGRGRRPEMRRNDDSDSEVMEGRHWKDARGKRRGARHVDSDASGGDNQWDDNDVADGSDRESDVDHSDEAHSYHRRTGGVQRKLEDFRRDNNTKGFRRNAGGPFQGKGATENSESEDEFRRENNTKGFRRNARAQFRGEVAEENSESEDMLSDLDNAMWESDADEEHKSRLSRPEASRNYRSSSDGEDDPYPAKRSESGSFVRSSKVNGGKRMVQEDSESEDMFSESEIAAWESDNEENLRACDQDYRLEQDDAHGISHEKAKAPKDADENWDSD